MTLLDLHEGDSAEISAVEGDHALTRRMLALGLAAGRRIRFLRAGPFSGPLLVEELTSGARIMVARAIARLIEVRHGPRRAG